MPCCSVAGLTICSEAKMPALEDSFHEPVQPLTKNIFFQPNRAALNPAFKQAPRYRAVPSNPIQVQDYCDNKQTASGFRGAGGGVGRRGGTAHASVRGCSKPFGTRTRAQSGKVTCKNKSLALTAGEAVTHINHREESSHRSVLAE